MIKSIIRGFGGQIGRHTANEVINSKRMSFGKFVGYLFLGALIGILIIAGLVYWASTGDTYKESQKQYQQSLIKDSVNKTEYYKGHVIFTGKNGGKYYLTKSGKKKYI